MRRLRIRAALALTAVGAAAGAFAARPAEPPPLPPAAVPLVEFVGDPDGDGEALARLAEVAARAPDEQTRVAAVEQIARVQVPNWHARHVLREIAAHDASPKIRDAAETALAEVQYEAKLRQRTPRLQPVPMALLAASLPAMARASARARSPRSRGSRSASSASISLATNRSPQRPRACTTRSISTRSTPRPTTILE